MLNKLILGTIVNFKTKYPGILGNTYEDVLVVCVGMLEYIKDKTDITTKEKSLSAILLDKYKFNSKEEMYITIETKKKEKISFNIRWIDYTY